MLRYDETVDRLYGITLSSDQVVRKEYSFSDFEGFKLIKRLVNHFIKHPDPMVVPVFKFETLIEKFDVGSTTFGTFSYAYEMKRLFMLDHTEKDIISTCIRKYKPTTRDDPDPRIQRAWRENQNLVEFMNTVLGQGRYNDLHSGNFLKDENEEYKIIDLEGFMKYPADGETNNWITK